MRLFTAGLLCFAALAGCTPFPTCPKSQIACGTGCIPADGVCCSPASTSYCTNAAVDVCSPNPAGKCSAAFPAGASAEFCCSASSSAGSSDCPSGQHHCGLACRPVSENCCARSTDACTGGGVADGGGGGGGNGQCLLQGAHPTCASSSTPDCCAPSSIGCDGMTVASLLADSCMVKPSLGQKCYEAGNIDLPGCCNTSGGHASVGTYSSQCPVPSRQVNDCTTDADCVLGEACAFSSFYGKKVCGFSPGSYCIVGDSSSTPSTQSPCCDGLVLGTKGTCGFPAGSPCLMGRHCASGTCVPGATTATCK